jgi:hypothetical protein
MTSNSDPAVLIIAYRRTNEVHKILQLCKENGVNRIYVALDGPKFGNVAGKKDNLEIRQLLEDFKVKYSGNIMTLFRDHNAGCASSCLSACDWVFENEEHAIILEDDCIPSTDFFKFARHSITELDADNNLWLACGTQFAPNRDRSESWSLSRYALIWGWVTSQKKWKEISIAIYDGRQISNRKGVSLWERTYWNQGARRAYGGWKDVWDTILLQQMIANGKYSIIPNEPLVSNVGDDTSATHTLEKSPWLHLDFGTFQYVQGAPTISKASDDWLRKNFYKISLRHLFTTRITLIRDNMTAKRVPLRPLRERWEKAEFNRKIQQSRAR